MPRITDNAELYASTRIGIFFPAHNQTSADGNLTGQCVTLNKWFLAEMTDVPSPFAARGDARYVGQTLVNQGHAVVVPYEQRRRGDFAVFEYGQYGHIGVLLDQERIFEQNVNVGGVARRWVDGAYVYASRIGRLSESWRPVRATIYRIKSYNEKGSELMIIQNAENWYGRCNKTHWQIRGRELSRATFNNFVGTEFLHFVEICSDDPEADTVQNWQEIGKNAAKDRWDLQIYSLQAQLKELGKRPTQAQLDELNKQVTDLSTQSAEALKRAEAAEKRSAELEVEHIEAEKTGNAFMRWLGEQLNKIIGKG